MADRIPLLFSLSEPRPDAVGDVQRLVRHLNAARQWATGEIEMVNDTDATSVTQADDDPIWTLGGVLWLYEASDSSHERRQFEDVRFLFDELCRFSASKGEVVVEYGGEEVGSIRGGQLDESLRAGLLAEWERGL